MKKYTISILIAVIFIISILPINYVQARDPDAPSSSSTSTDESTWVKDAFTDAKDFMQENPKEVFGFENKVLKFFTNIVKGVNMVLIVTLFGISTIAISIAGFRYLVSGAAPDQRQAARDGLRKTFIGMAYGFGAYTIWTVSMNIVKLIIGTFT